MIFFSFLDDLFSLDLPNADFPTKTKKQRNKIIDKPISATELVRNADWVYKSRTVGMTWFKCFFKEYNTGKIYAP